MSQQNNSPEYFLNLARLTADQTVALEYYLKAAEGGLTQAMTAVGNIYLEGEVVTRDVDEALNWFKKAAALGNPTAINNIGYIYEQRDENKLALEWYVKAVEIDKDSTLPLRNLAFTYAKVGEVDKAIEFYKKAVERGDIEAMNALGDLYFDNENFIEAEDYYKQAAKLGHVEAMANLGRMLIYGNDFISESYHWLKKAIDKGYDYALMYMGDLFEENMKYRKAIRWYKRAQAIGIPEAKQKIREVDFLIKKNENVGCKLYVNAI